MAVTSTPDPYPRRLFWLLAIGVLAWAFWSLSAILLPVVMGAFAAFALWPIVTRLPDRWPHIAKVGIALLVALAAVVAFFLILVPSLVDQAKSLVQQYPSYLETITRLSHEAQLALDRYGIQYDWAQVQGKLLQWAQDVGLALAGWLGATLQGALGNLLQLVIAFWVLVYALLEGPAMIAFFQAQLPEGQRHAYLQVMATIGEVLTGFIRGMVLLGLIIGVAVGVGVWLLGMPYALLIGLVAGLLEAIPSFGPLIAGAFAAFLALAQGPWMAAKVVALFAVIQVVENNLIVPKVMGESLDVHPMVIFLAALVGAKLFGLAGLFLAGPFVAVLWRLWQLRANLQAPPPAPEPVESAARPPSA